jgi:4,5-dihydroxyphthalate decarboxylase
MARLPLTFACGRYDRTQALRSGEVQPEGIDLNYIAIEASREIFDRMVGNKEFDCAELSTSEYVRMVDAGEKDFVAIPVFPSRCFRHGFIFINRNAGIRTPKDLEGKRIGTGLYTQTAAVWIRGHLHNDFGVDFSNVKWVQGAIEKAGPHGQPTTRPLLKPVDIVENESPYSLAELLARGEIDAMIPARRPPNFGKNPDIVRLFPNFSEIERDLYRRTKIHPVMHLLAIRRDVYERHPWIATSLFKAFQEAKDFAVDLMRVSITQSTMFPWHLDAFDEIETLMGGDPWPYGIEPNRSTLEALISYLHQQHMISRKMPVEELFVPIRGLFD